MTNKLLNSLCRMYDSIYTDKPYRNKNKNKKTVSFLVYKGKVISFGVNSAKTSPLQKYYRSRTDLKEVENFIDMEHSEINCLRRFDGDVKWHKVELVIISKQKDGKFRLARPCKVCMSAIKDFGIHKIYYTTKSQTFMFEEV